ALGGGPATSLEEAFIDCCRFGTPTAGSLGYALRQLYSRLYERFYRRSFVPAAASHFGVDPGNPYPSCLGEPDPCGRRVTLLRSRVEQGLQRFREPPAPGAGGDQGEERRRLRRAALATLVLGDQPAFLDPVDYLHEAVAYPGRVPSMLAG